MLWFKLIHFRVRGLLWICLIRFIATTCGSGPDLLGQMACWNQCESKRILSHGFWLAGGSLSMFQNWFYNKHWFWPGKLFSTPDEPRSNWNHLSPTGITPGDWVFLICAKLYLLGVSPSQIKEWKRHCIGCKGVKSKHVSHEILTNRKATYSGLIIFGNTNQLTNEERASIAKAHRTHCVGITSL